MFAAGFFSELFELTGLFLIAIPLMLAWMVYRAMCGSPVEKAGYKVGKNLFWHWLTGK